MRTKLVIGLAAAAAAFALALGVGWGGPASHAAAAPNGIVNNGDAPQAAPDGPGYPGPTSLQS